MIFLEQLQYVSLTLVLLVVNFLVHNDIAVERRLVVGRVDYALPVAFRSAAKLFDLYFYLSNTFAAELLRRSIDDLHISVSFIYIPRQCIDFIFRVGFQAIPRDVFLAYVILSAKASDHIAHIGKAHHRTPLLKLRFSLTFLEETNAITGYVGVGRKLNRQVVRLRFNYRSGNLRRAYKRLAGRSEVDALRRASDAVLIVSGNENRIVGIVFQLADTCHLRIGEVFCKEWVIAALNHRDVLHLVLEFVSQHFGDDAKTIAMAIGAALESCPDRIAVNACAIL